MSALSHVLPPHSDDEMRRVKSIDHSRYRKWRRSLQLFAADFFLKSHNPTFSTCSPVATDCNESLLSLSLGKINPKHVENLRRKLL